MEDNMKPLTAVICIAILVPVYGLLFPEDQHNFDNGKSTLTVTAFGDPQCITYDNHIKNHVMPTYLRAMSFNPDLMVIAGDMNEHGQNLYHWDTLESILRQAKVPYEAPNTLFYPVHGDHCTKELTSMAQWDARWRDRFDLPGNETNYTFQRNNILFIAISFPALPLTGFHIYNNQYAWVENILQRAQTDPSVDWIYVYFHDPLSWQSSQYAKLFTKYGVNIVHHGDKHKTYWTYPIKYDINASSPSPALAPPGQGFNVFEAGVGCYTAATWPHMEGMRQHMAVMKMEFTGKVLKVTVVGTTTGATSGTWNAITLRNGKVTFDAVKASPDQVAVAPNATSQLSVAGQFSDGTSSDITDPVLCDMWSLDSSVASVSGDGLVTGKTVGTTQIVVKSRFERTGNFDFDKYDTVNVVVAPASVSGSAAVLPGRFFLGGFPNPSKGPVSIPWAIPENGQSVLSIFSVTGERVFRTNLQGMHGTCLWKGAKTGGIYFIRLESANKKMTKRVLITK
jgi:hypothetical protein